MTLIAASARRRSGTTPPEPPDIPTSAPYNVATFIHIPTYDGSNQAVHLDVIDFRNEPNEGDTWNGYRFWMAMTPYPNSLASWEDPSILVSQDGLAWQVPPGLTNPLYRPVEGPYNNDPDIVYDHVNDELVLFYRDYDVLKMASSPDGITWPETPTTVIEYVGVSPRFLLDQDGTWRGWFNGGHRTAPAPVGPWTSLGANTGVTDAWHSNTVYAPGGGYHMLMHSNVDYHIRVASSANGTAWTTKETPVLVAGTYDWSFSNLYRPALTLHEDGDRYRVWYSGQGPYHQVQALRYVWRVGYTEIPLAEWPTPP